MHDATREFVSAALARHGPFTSILEIGGRDVNGTLRDLYGRADVLVVDRVEGPNVDVVADFLTWEPPGSYSAVVCTNVFEHERCWRDLVSRAYDALNWLGVAIFATVGPGFPPHSGVDGLELRDGEWYGGIEQGELNAAMTAAGFAVVESRLDDSDETQAVGVKVTRRG